MDSLLSTQEYSLKYLCQDHETFTADLITEVLSASLHPISLVHYPETYLPAPPDDEDLVPILLDDWDRKGLLAQNGDYYDEKLDHDEDVMVWMRQAKKASTEAGRRFSRLRMLQERGPYVPAVPRPLSPILSRKAMRETPRINDPTYVDPLVPRSMDALLNMDILEPIPSDEFDDEPKQLVTEDEALDLRPSMTSEEVDQVAALLNSIPLPKKKEKKKNAILVTAEERSRSNALVLHPSWGRRSKEVRAETKERYRSISPPIFPRRINSHYYEMTGRSNSTSTIDSSSSRPSSTSLSGMPTRSSDLVAMLFSAPTYDPTTGKLVDQAEDEIDELDEDPFSMYDLNATLRLPNLPEDVKLALSPDEVPGEADPFDIRFHSEFNALRARHDQTSDSDSDMSDLDVPQIARARTLEAHREDEDVAAPITLQEAIAKVMGPADRNESEQHDDDAVEPAQEDALSQLIIQDISDPDGDGEPSCAGSPSLAVEPSSAAEDGQLVPYDFVTRALARLPGGQEEIGKSVESWIERERWDENEEDYWEVPKLRPTRTYFEPHPALKLSKIRDVFRPQNPEREEDGRLRLSPTPDDGARILSYELAWRPFPNRISQPEVLQDDIFEPVEGDEEAAAVKALFASQRDLVRRPPINILADSLPRLSSAADNRLGDAIDHVEDEYDVIYTRKESIIRREQKDKGGKRPLSHVDAQDEQEKEQQVPSDEADVEIQSEAQLPAPETNAVAPTVSEYSRSPPRVRRKLSAIEEETEDDVRTEVDPMEDTHTGLFSSSKPSSPAVSPSPPTSNGTRWGRTRLTQTIKEHVDEESDHDHYDDQAQKENEPAEPLSVAEDEMDEMDEPTADEAALEPVVDPALAARSGLSHFLTSRGKGHLAPQRSQPSVASPRAQLQPQADSAPAALTEDDSQPSMATVDDKGPLPANVPEFDTAWLSGGVAPGEHTKATPPVLHVVSGQRLLQNRTALRLLRSSLVQPHDRPLSDLLASRPHFGIDMLISPVAGVLLTPLRTLPPLLQDLLRFLPTVKHKLDRLFVVLVLPAEREGIDAWTPPVKAAVGKLRRGIAMLDSSGGGEADGSLVIKAGWATEEEVGRLTRGLVLAEVDAGSGRGGEESWTGSWLGQKEGDENEEASDEWEEEEHQLSLNTDLNPYSAAFIHSTLTTDEFLSMTEAARLGYFGSLLGEARVTRLNKLISLRNEQLHLSSPTAFSPTNTADASFYPPTTAYDAFVSGPHIDDDGRLVSYDDDDDRFGQNDGEAGVEMDEETVLYESERLGRQEDGEMDLVGPGSEWSEADEIAHEMREEEPDLERGVVRTVYD